MCENECMKNFLMTKMWLRFCQQHPAVFPALAEVRFVRMMGGRVTTLPFIRHAETSRPLAVVWTLGRVLRAHKFKHRVVVGVSGGETILSFGNDIHWGIELDGLRYHNDILVKQDLDEFFSMAGWRVLHITTTKMQVNPAKIRDEVFRFLSA